MKSRRLASVGKARLHRKTTMKNGNGGFWKTLPNQSRMTLDPNLSEYSQLLGSNFKYGFSLRIFKDLLKLWLLIEFPRQGLPHIILDIVLRGETRSSDRCEDHQNCGPPPHLNYLDKPFNIGTNHLILFLKPSQTLFKVPQVSAAVGKPVPT